MSRASIAVTATVLMTCIRAEAQVGGGFDLSWNTIDAGGGLASGGTFALAGTIGQHNVTVMTGGIFQLDGGFWPGASDRVACRVDLNADGIVTSQDFFDFLNAFFAGSPNADFNNDGSINSQDFFDFLAAFFAGC